MQHSNDIRNSADVNALLESAAARNLPMELHVLRKRSNQIIVARTRVLNITKEELQLDRPQIIGGELSFVAGQHVDLYFRMDDKLYHIETSVRRIPVPIELRESKSLIGITVARPSVVLSGQRRNSFRILVAAMDPIRMTFHDASRDINNTAPINAARYVGEMIDISLGGVGIRVDTSPPTAFSTNGQLYLSFRLAEEEQQHILLGRVRQARAIPNTCNTRLGIEFLPWPNQRMFQRVQDDLQHFITRVQRERLRKVG